MKKKIVMIILLITGICSFKSFGQTPLQFNNQMASITDSLYAKGLAWGTLLTQIAKGPKDFTRLQPLRLGAESFIDVQAEKLNNLQDVSGSYNLRQAMISYLKFERQIVEEQFKPFESFTAQTTDETVQSQINTLLTAVKREKDFLDQVNVAQAAYAKENNFTINQRNQ